MGCDQITLSSRRDFLRGPARLQIHVEVAGAEDEEQGGMRQTQRCVCGVVTVFAKR